MSIRVQHFSMPSMVVVVVVVVDAI